METYLSPICPINFTYGEDKNTGELDRTYIQQFVQGDSINLQVVGEIGLSVFAKMDNMIITSSKNVINDDTCAYTIKIDTNELETYKLYTIEVYVNSSDTDSKTYVSQNFIEIVECCDNLKLIEYYDEQNITPYKTYFRDNNNLEIVRFYLRVPLGYKSTSHTEQVEMSTFRNQNQALRVLYAVPYSTQTLIIGDGLGIPYWLAKMINYIFCLSDVWINGKRVVRGDGATLERQGEDVSYPFHVYNLAIENYDNIEFPRYSSLEFTTKAVCHIAYTFVEEVHRQSNRKCLYSAEYIVFRGSC